MPCLEIYNMLYRKRGEGAAKALKERKYILVAMG